jgi:hypothetical protein
MFLAISESYYVTFSVHGSEYATEGRVGTDSKGACRNAGKCYKARLEGFCGGTVTDFFTFGVV